MLGYAGLLLCSNLVKRQNDDGVDPGEKIDDVGDVVRAMFAEDMVVLMQVVYMVLHVLERELPG